MTPKEKAKELVDKFYLERSRDDLPLTMYWTSAIGCAIIAVDEIIRVTPWGGDIDNEIEDGSKEFYMKVKKEIESL